MVHIRCRWKSQQCTYSRRTLPLLVANSRLLQRPSWIPFFDDVQAIIFLAPLAFNLMLEEDSRVNRLVSIVSPTDLDLRLPVVDTPPISQEDSIGLWRTICENKLLEGATLILFFNKVPSVR